MTLTVPKLALVLLVGPSGSGKSTFARRHFLSTEIVSSDVCRGIVCDDENSQEATGDAFELLRFIVRKRLERGRLTVVDATNVQSADRASLIAIGHHFHVPCVAIVLNLPEELCRDRNASRPDRQFGPHVIRNQIRNLRQSLRNLEREGFNEVYKLESFAEVEAAEITRVPLWPDRTELTGPFDIIGDIHGCADELIDLLASLGYLVRELDEPEIRANARTGPRTPGGSEAPIYFHVEHPQGRTAVFVGDLVDRGPKSPKVVKLVATMVRTGIALAVPGNHDDKLVRYLKGSKVKIAHGLQATIDQFDREPESVRADAKRFLDSLVSHVVLDGGKLVVAHAGINEGMIGRASRRIRDFCLYGDVSGETDDEGLPVRYPWANDYRGDAMVVYGHTPVADVERINHTVNIDTGCVFGGRLTALRYPEREFVSVPARHMYAEPRRPFLDVPTPHALSSQHLADDILDIAEVSGKLIIQTQFGRSLTIPEMNSAAALETISRFSADPKWLVYLPPTMSPPETSEAEGYLERPEEAFDYFASNGIYDLVCEEKHMGSRAVILVGRDEEATRRVFGVRNPGLGAILTRTGRHFFDRKETEQALLARVVEASERAGLWEKLDTDWMILDAELMPWSAKAQELILKQYAPVGTAAVRSTGAALQLVTAAPARSLEIEELQARVSNRVDDALRYSSAYRRYCWPVESLDDYRIAPFHLLASNGAVHADKPNAWHMATLAPLGESPSLMATRFRPVDIRNSNEIAAAVGWWEEITAAGGEGMVVKSNEFVVKGERGVLQPAIKCRGREYLRIIYGPDYLRDENLRRLRKRGLKLKRSLAQREFMLGIEALTRFVRREPLRRVHECVFAILALESEPVDPRL